MKTYKNLWDQFVSMENLELAAKKAIKSKKSKAMVQNFLANKTQLLLKLRQDLINGTFTTSPYVVFKIYEPKEREIYMLPLYPDHVVQHALINVLGPIWHKMFIRDSYACIPMRGLHAGSQRIMHFIRRNRYALQCDVRKFFPSINHDIMMNIIRRKIADGRIVNVLENIVRYVGDPVAIVAAKTKEAAHWHWPWPMYSISIVKHRQAEIHVANALHAARCPNSSIRMYISCSL